MICKNPIFYMAFSGLLVACGGTSKIASLPLETLEGKNIPSISEKPNKDDLKTWPHRDLLTSGYPGISLEKAYNALKKGSNGNRRGSGFWSGYQPRRP